MTLPECFYRISVKALILDDHNRFLLVKEDNGYWELPGGGLDFGESPQEGIKREIWEEMRLETSYVEAHPSYFFTTVNHKGVFMANVMYETRMVHLDFVPSPECVEIVFSPLGRLLRKNTFIPTSGFLRKFSPPAINSNDLMILWYDGSIICQKLKAKSQKPNAKS